MRGEMLWFNGVKEHGYIATEDGERLYVHRSGFDGTAPVGRCAGRPVEFRLVEGGTGRRAEGVCFFDDVAAQRARPRRGGTRLSTRS